jgi:hypothetical protein
MKKYVATITAIAIFVAAASFTIKSLPEEEVPFPEGYRMWTHIKTGLVGPANPMFQFVGGYHHIYANEKAMKGYTSGYFPEGSILVFDVLEANESDGNTTEGKRRHVDVMVKDSLKYAATGGWGYEEFKEGDPDRRVLTTAIKANCFKCHAKQPDYVFSDFRK